MTRFDHHQPQDVLVVEDDRDAAEMMGEVFALLGHRCRIANDGMEALALSRAIEFDLAILDLRLPDISGYEVARMLRAMRGSTIYLTALSGFADAAHRDSAIAVGFDRYMLKPASISEFEMTVAAAQRSTMRAPPRLSA